jgi:probable addiction module antidote protein
MHRQKTEPFAPARHLTSPASQTDLLFDALATGDASHVAHALCVIALARFTSETAREAGITHEAQHSSLSEDGDPRPTTPLGVMRALGVRLTAEVG